MKTRLIVVFVILTLTVSLEVQCQIAPNRYVTDAFSGNQIESMSKERIDYLNYISKYAWEIVDIPQGKEDADFPLLYNVDNETKLTMNSVLKCSDLDSFNILTFNYSIKKERNYYRIEGCNKWLVIKSHKEITAGYNGFKNI